MRVLCIDYTGKLESNSSPVFNAEYHTNIVCIPSIKDAQLDDTYDFLEYGDDKVEVWIILKPDFARKEIESLRSDWEQYCQEFQFDNVYGVLLNHLERGAEASQFLNQNQNKTHQVLIDFNQVFQSETIGIKTLWIGNVFSENTSIYQKKLISALSLRVWFCRNNFAHQWIDNHFRLLVTYHDKKVIESLVSKKCKEWANVYSALNIKRNKLENDPSVASLHDDNPSIHWNIFDQKQPSIPKLIKPFILGLALKDNEKYLTSFYTSSDVSKVRNWLNRPFTALNQAVEKAWAESNDTFKNSLKNIYNQATSSNTQTTNKTPQALKDEIELSINKNSFSEDAIIPPALLIEKQKNKQNDYLNASLEILRHRPTANLFFLSVLLGVLLFSLVFFFHLDPGLTQASYWIDGAQWFVGGLLVLSSAIMWALKKSQQTLRKWIKSIKKEFGLLWTEASNQHNKYNQFLAHKLQRIIQLRNLDILVKELDQRQLEIRKIIYHLNTLNRYHKLITGTDIIFDESATSYTNLNTSLPEMEGDVYNWPESAQAIEVGIQIDNRTNTLKIQFIDGVKEIKINGFKALN